MSFGEKYSPLGWKICPSGFAISMHPSKWSCNNIIPIIAAPTLLHSSVFGKGIFQPSKKSFIFRQIVAWLCWYIAQCKLCSLNWCLPFRLRRHGVSDQRGSTFNSFLHCDKCSHVVQHFGATWLFFASFVSSIVVLYSLALLLWSGEPFSWVWVS